MGEQHRSVNMVDKIALNSNNSMQIMVESDAKEDEIATCRADA